MTETDLAQPTAVPFRFSGRGGEFFGIWIVNLLLTVLTLGIYSAWAKVRTRQYFYGSTTLDGRAFEYTADPLAILKGRLIVVGVLVAYGVASAVFPGAEGLFWLVILPVIPWAVIRALAFNARYSGHRNVQFGFAGRYWAAFGAYLGWPALGALAFGLLLPYAAFKRRAFMIDNSRFGTSRFTFGGSVGRFYKVSLAAVGGFILCLVAAGFLASAHPALAIAAGLLVVLAYVAIRVAVDVALTNHVWQSTRLRENRFDARLEVGPMVWIYVNNLLLIVLTLGIWIPFAQVNIARYRIERMSVYMVESMDAFADRERERVGALGGEIGDALDLDLAL